MKKFTAMQKFVFVVCSMFFLLPVPSLAVSVIDGFGEEEKQYVYNDESLIMLQEIDGTVYGQAWSEDDWTEVESIATTGVLDSNWIYTAHELADGSLVATDGNFYISYSSDSGFNYSYSEADFVISAVVHNTSQETFINCSDSGTMAFAAAYDIEDGLGEQVELANSFCAGEVTYFTGGKQVVIDYYSGNAYDVSDNYSTIDSIDLSALNYTDEDDDYDPQGNNPVVFSNNNGDAVFGFNEFLYGYSYKDRTWRPVVQLDEGFSLITNADTEYDESIIQTNDEKSILAFAMNEDGTEYRVYQWTSNAGWVLIETFEFDAATELILPERNNMLTKLHWAFWTDETNTVTVYRWSAVGGFDVRATKNVICNNQCRFELEISKKGKLFLNTNTGTTLFASAWKPNTAIWQNKKLISGASLSFAQTSITSWGQWLVEFNKGTKRYAIRWTPDGGWGKTYGIVANRAVFQNNRYYLTKVDSNNQLTFKRLNWKNGFKIELGSIEGVDTLSEQFFLGNEAFFYFEDTNGENVLQEIEL